MRQKTHSAESATDGLLWDLGKHLPFVGANIGSFQTVSSALDIVTRENAPVALQLSKAVEEGRFRPQKARLDIHTIESLAPGVRRAAASITGQEKRLDRIDPEKLTFPVKDLFVELTSRLNTAGSAARSSATAFDLLPDMLGKDGPRRYLLLIQNNAEIRATGGIPGSIAVLRADHGKVTMGFQGGPSDLGAFRKPAVSLPQDALNAYGSTIATDLRDATFNPDFPEVAKVAAAMMGKSRNVKVDGVLSVDPVALAPLLQATGPVQVQPGVTLTGANVIQVLLNTTYQVIADPQAQNTFFAKSARAVFDSVMSGRGSQQQLITGLASGVNQHRVLVWSAHPDQEKALVGTAVAGELAGGPADRPQVGFYLNDATAGKPEYYLDYQSSVTATQCRAHGAQDLDASIALTSTMPRDFSKLSFWITGTGAYTPKGTIAVNLRVYSPVGGEIRSMTVNGKPYSVTADRQQDRQIGVVPLALKPGQRVVVASKLRTARGQQGDPVVSMTPGITPTANGVSVPSACS